ncbi:Ubox domain containing protein [Acanthamoeba castellanii str. Neff]|uniref:Ubox domain containing protein n=1 Tax=Acanthamoeba castellanii (strain ATCC 30010 / Neff) TaxID=1257118 RepID=L8HJ41_ACACF|nr:Ubox domain containing protein [Acanthamoeba castellanii str. Neff]ELR25200.1 Ubox domain containing protein [Acanthamoeba castellanii str. Neff]
MHSGSESEDSSMEPEEFSDPITLSLMEEAMMAAGCGHSFSKASITTWLRQNHSVCPVCKSSLTEAQLVPNYALRSAIERYQTKRGHTVRKSDSAQTPMGLLIRSRRHLCTPARPLAHRTGNRLGSTQKPMLRPPPLLVPFTLRLEAATWKKVAAAPGCCTCTCDGPVYCCKTARECEQRTACPNSSYPWYKSLSGFLCIYFYGTDSSYNRRTLASVCLAPLALVLCVILLLELVFLCVFWVVAFFVISPIWLFARIPITMLCPLYFDQHIKDSCWNKTPKRLPEPKLE